MNVAHEATHWQQLIEQRTGLLFQSDLHPHLLRTLRGRLEATGCESLEHYRSLLEGSPGAAIEWRSLMDRLSVRETRFFRDPQAFAAVGNYLDALPPSALENAIDAWSVGCASGEEVWSLAMVIHSVLTRRRPKAFFSITGTDISPSALEQARAARYRKARLAQVPPEWQARYLEPATADATGQEQHTVVAQLRARCGFFCHDCLSLPQAALHGMQIIFCQNLLIYFRQWRRRQIIQNLVQRLRPGGLLVLGAGEITHWSPPGTRRWPDAGCLAFCRDDA